MMVLPLIHELITTRSSHPMQRHWNWLTRCSCGSLAISNETHGFASRPHDRFAFIEELVVSSVGVIAIKTSTSDFAAVKRLPTNRT